MLRVVIVVLHVVLAIVVFSGGDTPMHIYITYCMYTCRTNKQRVLAFLPIVYTRHSCSNNVSGTVVQASRHPDLFLEDLSGVVPCFSLY